MQIFFQYGPQYDALLLRRRKRAYYVERGPRCPVVALLISVVWRAMIQEFTSAFVSTNGCIQSVGASKGNTHVRKPRLRFVSTMILGHQMRRWLRGEVFVRLLRNYLRYENLKLSLITKLMIQHWTTSFSSVYFCSIRSKSKISIWRRPNFISNLAYGGVLASLETIRLNDFEFTDSALAIVLGSLVTVPNLKTLDLDPVYEDEGSLFPLTRECERYLVQLAHSNSLAHMIGDNSGLRMIPLGSNTFTRKSLFTLLPGLSRNTGLWALNVEPSLGKRICGTDAFDRRVLSDTSLRVLTVGPWDVNDAKSLIMIAAKNYHIEHVFFLDSERTHAYRLLEGTITAISKLNMAGRCYLCDRNKGLASKTAIVNVLSRVSNDLDSSFYHLRENPFLCDLGERTSKKKSASVVGTTKPDLGGWDSRNSKKRRMTP